MMTDELRMRAITSLEIGMEAPERSAVTDTGKGGRILLVDDRASSYERLAPMLSAEHSLDVETNPTEALFRAAEGNYDLLIVSLSLDDFDGLRLCSQIRSLERTRQVPILAISDADNNARLLRGLEIGVNDYLLRPVDKNELLARARTQIRKRRYTDHLRDNVQNSIEMAITDALTGLHNRRYMESHLATLAEQAASRGKPLALMMLDIDFFKAVNDSYGHDAGDDVLREFAVRIRKSIRGIDLACRYGGEEFVIVMPETDLHVAGMVAERLRRSIAGEPFAASRSRSRSDCRRWSARASRSPTCSSARIRRSTAPSTTGVTGWWRRRRKALAVIPRESGVSSTPRLLREIANVSGILGRPPARAMTVLGVDAVPTSRSVASISLRQPRPPHSPAAPAPLPLPRAPLRDRRGPDPARSSRRPAA
jgi:diguanylate cyclase (GGDEF)-like protein